MMVVYGKAHVLVIYGNFEVIDQLRDRFLVYDIHEQYEVLICTYSGMPSLEIQFSFS